jgi:hypothetical protein
MRPLRQECEECVHVALRAQRLQFRQRRSAFGEPALQHRLDSEHGHEHGIAGQLGMVRANFGDRAARAGGVALAQQHHHPRVHLERLPHLDHRLRQPVLRFERVRVPVPCIRRPRVELHGADEFALGATAIAVESSFTRPSETWASAEESSSASAFSAASRALGITSFGATAKFSARYAYASAIPA